MSTNEAKIVFSDVGIADHLSYEKADIVKVSQVSGNYSLSFYQLDYQAMALHVNTPKAKSADGISSQIEGSQFLIPVGKIVLDERGYRQMVAEIDQIKEQMQEKGRLK